MTLARARAPACTLQPRHCGTTRPLASRVGPEGSTATRPSGLSVVAPPRQPPSGTGAMPEGATVLGWGLFGEMIADHGVEGDGDLAHAGDESDFARLSIVAESAVEGFDGGVVADRAQG